MNHFSFFKKMAFALALFFICGPASATSRIPIGPKGQVDRQALRAYLHERITHSRLNGYMPEDGAKYGVDGSVNSWVNHFMALAKYESNYNTRVRNDADDGGSLGLFQVSVHDGFRYRANPERRNWTEQQLLGDPAINASTAVSIYERNVIRDGRIVRRGSHKGAGGYFAGTSMRKIAREVANGTIGRFNPSATATASTQPEIRRAQPVEIRRAEAVRPSGGSDGSAEMTTLNEENRPASGIGQFFARLFRPRGSSSQSTPFHDRRIANVSHKGGPARWTKNQSRSRNSSVSNVISASAR
ncbi:MAG: hypothetical protein KGQ59_07520 [Bdellovibrionales bacterium]|nr:hypothetical protein [Bdellovibrionales bacterium]